MKGSKMSKIEALATYLLAIGELDQIEFEEYPGEEDFKVEDESLESLYGDRIEDNGDNTFSIDGSTYMVLTDSEADDRADDYLDAIVDELVDEMSHHLPKSMQQTLHSYFDYDGWKRDAKFDGRGCLASYDGEENEVRYNGVWFYIYQMG